MFSEKLWHFIHLMLDQYVTAFHGKIVRNKIEYLT